MGKIKKKKLQKITKKTAKKQVLELKGFLSFFILHELSLEQLTGEELGIKIGKRKGTVLTPGTIYPALKKLRKQKLLAFKKQGRRKVYGLTEQGKKELKLLYNLFSSYFYGLKNKIKRR